MDPVSIIVTLAIGGVAGWLASFVVGGGGGLLKYIVWGVLGSVIGGFLLPAIGLSVDLDSALINQIVVATIGAIVLVLVARAIG